MFFIRQNPCPMSDCYGFLKGATSYYGAQITNLSSSQQKSTDITIMTAEGDKVTLSANIQKETSYVTYKGFAREGGARVRLEGQSTSMEVNRELSLKVEGDLSERELKDIQKAIKTIDKIMREALSGNVDQALSLSGDVTHMESITGFSASLEMENRLSYERQNMFETQTTVTGPTMEQAVGAAKDPVREVPSRGDFQTSDRFDRVADKMMEALEQGRVQKRKFIQPLSQYFSKLREGIAKNDQEPEKSGKMETACRISSKILKRLEKENEEEPAADAGPESELKTGDPGGTAAPASEMV